MKLVCEFVSYQELSAAERVIIACSGEEFCFLRYGGVLKINRALPKQKTLVKIAQAMWQIDHLLEGESADRMDDLWQQAKTIAGDDGAMQLYSAWHQALKEKLDAENKEAAKAWLDGRNVPDELDAIGDLCNYSSGLLNALWAISKRSSDAINAIFLYGCQIGMEAAGKEAKPA